MRRACLVWALLPVAVAQSPSLLRAPWRPRTPGGCADQGCCERQCAQNGHPLKAVSKRPSCAHACGLVAQGVPEEHVRQRCSEAEQLPADVCPNGDAFPEGGSPYDACMAGTMLGAAPALLKELAPGSDPEKINPGSFYWRMDIHGKSIGRAFSWYTRIFKLFQEGHPLNVQMGMGGTWLAAEGLSYDVCPCKPGGFGSDCCKTSPCNCAGWLFESFEGGPGYWFNELPSTVSKWRVGDSVGCYSYYTGSPLFQFGQWGGHDCDHMGLAQLSNRILMPPDGITFDVEGMVGVAYAHTPFGKVNATDDRNFWTIVLDTQNFAGPLAYFIPEFWRLRPKGYENVTRHLGDYSTCPDLSQGECAFEWNTLETYRASNGDFKIPKMTVPYKDGRTVLMMNNRAYNDSDVSDPLEQALQTGHLNVSRLFNTGKRHPCVDGTTDAMFGLYNHSTFSVGTMQTSVETGECVWSVQLHNESCPKDGDCWFPQYVRNESNEWTPIPESKAPPELQRQNFTTKTDSGNKYDQLSQVGSRKCLSSPGPADDKLYCVQTLKGVSASSTWIGYKWYKFVDQPGLQQANLSPEERSFMQKRVETLHRMTSQTSRWMKAGQAVDQGLSIIDEAAIVTPPEGMEYGYVPIVFYEAFAKPDGCATPPAPQPTPPSPPRPTPAPPPATPAPPPPSTCDGWCLSAGHCCNGTISSYNHPSCAMGCFIAKHTSSVTECESQCRQNDNKCSWSIAGTAMNNCEVCPKVDGRDCSAEDGVSECLFGCQHGF
eukprot:TRINITY_DN3767_c0_g1_i1.p1 TRINITY_DN3767_c0_g1~~TRINITY_DN3767_c0_g1_i1.p1  ORF type:complete len:769 (+),score=237.69 TRINITY_DN3767_c0_g1_i1:78-2384(+)